MSFFDNFSVTCKNCGYVNPHIDKFHIEYNLDCPSCGKRWIIKFKQKDSPTEEIYTNGCTIDTTGTF